MPHILWAEDSSVDRMFIQAVLNDVPERPIAEFVGDGDELLQRLASTRPDLIVLDLDMPNVGGLEVLAQLKARRNGVPVVVFSGAEGAATVTACYKLGARDVIRKPNDARKFRGGVERVMSYARPIVAA